MEILPISRTPAATEDILAVDAPRARRKWFVRPDWLFLLVVVAPVVTAIVYFGLLASPVYISESSFVVRNPEKPMPSGLGGILQTAGFTKGTEEVYAAQSFAASRDALRALNRNDAVERAYSRPEIFVLQRFDPLGVAGSFEDLYEYFKKKVAVQNDATTSITKLTVRAFNPRDAQRFNAQLLEMSEATVNQLNERGRRDLVQFAQNEVLQAKIEAQSAGAALAAYRNLSGVLDPEKQAEIQMQMVSKLQDQLISTRTELAQLRRYTPMNPRIPVLQSQLGIIESSMRSELRKVTGGNRSLAQSAVRYERLVLESEFANKQLTAALASLEQARNEAQRKQAYVERIVEPNLPDAPMEPRRLRGILATLALALLAYGILRMLLAGVKEHVQ